MSEPGIPIARRELLGSAVAVGAAAFIAGRLSGADSTIGAARLIDTNVNVGQWPFRRLPLDEPDLLVEELGVYGIAEAWAGSFESLLHRDLAGVNERLAETCAKFPSLRPIGSVNPELPNWELDLRRCAEHFHMSGIRLHPNYHGYRLDDPRFEQLLAAATDAGRFVQIAVAMEDVRTQHTLMEVPDVDLTPLPQVLSRLPNARVQILNWRPQAPLLKQLQEHSLVCFDTARVEATDGIGSLMHNVPPERVLFGSHAPFLILVAALIRVSESQLDADQLRALMSENAGRLKGTG